MNSFTVRALLAMVSLGSFALVAIHACAQPAPASASSQAAAPSANELAERMLVALGGRENWAKLKNTVNDSQQFRTTSPTEVRAIITMDFQSPRFKIETHGTNLHLIRVIDGERSWRKTREGAIDTVPKATYDDDMRWHAAHVYRTLHRIAKNDPALELKFVDGRLEAWEKSARLAWYKLNADHEPYAFGAHDDNNGTVSGPWKFAKDGIRHPIWTARPDGTWRASLNALETNVAIDDTTFAKPKTEKRS